MQPLDIRRISIVAAGAVALGGLIWLAVPSRTASSVSGIAAAAISVSAEPEALEMPPNVVTMLGVPEVIVNDGLSQPSEANNGSAPPEPAHAPPAAHAPPVAHAQPAMLPPTPAPKEAVRRAPTNSNTSLAKILSGQAPPPAARPAPRR